MDNEPNAIRVQSPFRRPREPAIVVAVIAAFLLIALLKPWSGGGIGSDGDQPRPQGAPSSTEVAIEAQPSPAATPPILDPNAMACLSDPGEQVVILERWAGHEVRSWVAAADTTATRPLDQHLVPVSFFSTHVIGLGICAPRAWIFAEQAAARFLDVQSIVRTANGPLAVDLGVPDPITLQLGGIEPAVLYGAPPAVLQNPSVGPSRSDAPADPTTAEPASPTADLTSPTPAPASGLPSPAGRLATWPTGSYAIAFQFPADGPHFVRWLRIDLIPGAGAAN